MSYQKHDNETDIQFIYRVINDNRNKSQPMTWQELSSIFNSILCPDAPRSESAYRKPYQAAMQYYDEVFSKCESRDEVLELNIAREKLKDQRRALNAKISLAARESALRECIKEAADIAARAKPYELANVRRSRYEDAHNEAVLFLSDWHYGMTCDNIWNTYNTEICKQRVKQLSIDVKRALCTHNIDILHVVILGDMAHGAIHTTARIEANENTVQQIMSVSEILCDLTIDLSTQVNETLIYSTYGNHLRTIQNKNDSTHADNMEIIIPWYMRQRLIDYEDIYIVDSLSDEIVKVSPCNSNIICVHGDLDKMDKAGQMFNTILTQKSGELVDYVAMGDKHKRATIDTMGIESIIVPSLCGSDDYAYTHRLFSKAGQTLDIFDTHGKLCEYNITF